MLEFHIQDVGYEGLKLNHTLDPDFFGLTEKDHIYFTEPLKFSSFIQLADNVLFCQCDVVGRCHGQCDRTLKPVSKEFDAHFTVDIEIDPKTQKVDLSEDVRQEVILALPVRMLADDQLLETENIRKNQSEMDSEGGTYQPFADLPDLET